MDESVPELERLRRRVGELERKAEADALAASLVWVLLEACPGELEPVVSEALATLGKALGVGGTGVLCTSSDGEVLFQANWSLGVPGSEDGPGGGERPGGGGAAWWAPEPASFPWLSGQLSRGRPARIGDLGPRGDAPGAGEHGPGDAERRRLLDAGVEALLVVPIAAHDLGGFVGVSCPTARNWSDDELGVLRTVGDAVASALGRRRHVREMATTERRHGAVLEALEEGLLLLDRDMRVVGANAAMCRMYGRSPEEMLDAGAGRRVLYDTEGQPLALEDRPVAHTLRTGEPVRGIEVLLERPDGTRRRLRTNTVPVRDHAGEIALVVASCLDVTEEAEALRALEESRAYLGRALEAGRMGLWSWQSDTGEFRYSAELAKLFGLGPGATVEEYSQAIHPHDRDAVFEVAREAVERGEQYRITYRILLPDGSTRWLEAEAEAVEEDGLVVGLAGVARDVTDRHEVEQALTESEERFRRAFEISPVGLAIVGSDGLIKEVNPALGRYTGYAPEELREASWRLITHPEEMGAVRTMVTALMEGERPTEPPDMRYPGAGGQTRWATMYVALLPVGEGPEHHFMCHLVDVTERHRAGEAVRALNAELVAHVAELDRTRADLALALAEVDQARADERRSIASDLHDGTIQAVVAATWSIDQIVPVDSEWDDPDAVPPEDSLEGRVRATKAILEGAVTELRRMIFRLHPRDLEMLGLGGALRPLLDQLGAESGLECVLVDRLEGRLGDEIEALAFRICREGLLNVRHHAQARRVEVALEVAGGRLLVSVTDDGVGVDADELSQRKAGGHVGLILARHSVLSAGGRFEIGAGPSGGTTMSFTLPLDRAAPSGGGAQ